MMCNVTTPDPSSSSMPDEPRSMNGEDRKKSGIFFIPAKKHSVFFSPQIPWHLRSRLPCLFSLFLHFSYSRVNGFPEEENFLSADANISQQVVSVAA